MKLKPSIKTLLYGFIALTILAPTFVLLPWFGHKGYSILLHNSLDKEAYFNQIIKVSINNEVRRIETLLVNKSDPIDFVLEEKNNIKFIRQLLSKIVKRESAIEAIALIDRNGVMLADNVRAGEEPVSVGLGMPEFVIPLHGRKYLGVPFLHADKSMDFLMGIPIGKGNKPQATLIARLDSHVFWTEVQQKNAQKGVLSYLVDNRGRLLAGPDRVKIPDGTLLTHMKIVRTMIAHAAWNSDQPYQGLDGVMSFGVLTPIEKVGWAVVSEVPKHTILAPILLYLKGAGVVALVVFLLFAGLGVLLAGKVDRQVKAFAGAFNRLAHGNYAEAMIKHVSSVKEFDVMGQDFNRMAREINLREDKLRILSQAIDQAGESIMITDVDGIIEYVNPAFTHLTGYATEDVLGKHVAMLQGSEGQTEYLRHFNSSDEGGNIWQGTLTGKKKDGSAYPAMMSVAPVRDNTATITHFISIQQDISEQVHLEEELRQSQKMEALGTLVGGIAHDFNNILAGIVGNAYLAKQLVKDQPTVVKKMETIDTLSARGAELIQHMLLFARKGIVEMKPISFGLFMQEAMMLVRNSVSEDIDLTCDFGVDELPILGDKTQLQQVMLNLLGNARDAVQNREHGKIALSLSRFVANKAFRAEHPEADRLSYACLNIVDNGYGISPKHLEKIFEPFFTTKSENQGTGLGLAMVYGVMQSHGGFIDVTSVEGEGTAFHLYFPIQAMDQEVSLPAEELLRGKGETILCVDDEASVREIVKETLLNLGYRVLEAFDGENALKIFIEHKDEISLVFSDVVMPRMSGPESVKKIREFAPTLPVIFATGYDMHNVLPDSNAWDYCLVVNKPLKVESFSRKIRNLIEAEAMA